MPSVGFETVASVREDDERIEDIAEITGLSPRTVRAKLRRAENGRMHVRRFFADRWPTSLEDFGGFTVAQIRRLTLSEELADAAGSTSCSNPLVDGPVSRRSSRSGSATGALRGHQRRSPSTARGGRRSLVRRHRSRRVGSTTRSSTSCFMRHTTRCEGRPSSFRGSSRSPGSTCTSRNASRRCSRKAGAASCISRPGPGRRVSPFRSWPSRSVRTRTVASSGRRRISRSSDKRCAPPRSVERSFRQAPRFIGCAPRGAGATRASSTRRRSSS